MVSPFKGSVIVRQAIQLAAVVTMLLPDRVLACWEEAGARYSVNPYLLYAIAKTESSLNPYAHNRNKNGSYDVGLMQINSSWFPVLRKYGIDEQQLYQPCVNIYVGAWILAQNVQSLGNSWEAVGAYNARNAVRRAQYALKVYKNLPQDALTPR